MSSRRRNKQPEYLIDTDWVADYLKGKEEAVKLLTELQPNGIAISLITYGEIYEGIYYGRHKPQHEKGFRAFLQGVEVLPLSLEIMKQFATIRGELRGKATLIGDMDLLIAASAMSRQLTLVTRNIKDFGRIRELSLYNPKNHEHSQSQQAA